MKLQEKHKEFVVKEYACFTKTGDILENFMHEFAPDTAEAFIENTTDEPDEEVVEEILQKKEQFTEKHTITLGGEMNIYQYKPTSIKADWEPIIKQINNYNQFLKQKFGNSFRRLNITHPQFPEKYRALFHQTREEYLANYRTTSLSIPENVILELETLYQLTKELAFENLRPQIHHPSYTNPENHRRMQRNQ